MEIIKKYIYAIQRRLPEKNFEDISQEINSLIFDELEGKYGKKDEYTDEEINTVLKEMGHPRQVAARYRGEKQLLIGEELAPIYKMVLAIVLGATTLGLIISFIVQTINTGDTITATYFLQKIAELFASILSSALATVGSITIIFFLIQHFGKFDSDKLDFYEDWTPKDLPDLPEEHDRVRIIEPIIAMFFIAVGFFIVNFFVAKGHMPYYLGEGSEVQVLPIFNKDVVGTLLPLWNISFAMSFVLQIILLISRKHTIGSKLFDIGISLLGIVIISYMLKSDMIFSIDDLFMKFGNESWIDTLNEYYYIVLKVIMGLSILGVVVNVIKLIVNQTRKANV